MTRYAIRWSALLACLLGMVPAESLGQGGRKLAPGVLTVIPPQISTDETFLGPLALTQVTDLQWQPSYAAETETLQAKASAVTLRHNVWALEFAFKPMRMLYVDIPQASGMMQRKLIWYMVYRIRNLGGHLRPVEDTAGPVVREPNSPSGLQETTFRPVPADEVLNVGGSQPTGSIRFFPHVVLESKELGKAYLDRVIPAAIPAIQAREMRGGRLYDSVTISRVDIPVYQAETPHEVWGVLTWEDIDPRVDFFSLYVQGLTNAFRLDKSPQGQILHLQKTLKLNFWRPGDTVNEHEREIRFGVPLVSDGEEQAAIYAKYPADAAPGNLPSGPPLDHKWVYRP